MRFGSVCSGIEAASAAWGPLGWTPAFFAEIDPQASAVLKHHHPEVKNYGDFTGIGADARPIDVLVGGTPCQSFSVAGLRGGLDDDRGNLALEFCRLADRLRPRWFVWENVPGVLSSNGGRDFGSILGAMGELGYGAAYRILDAQYAGVPQRRRRVFVVGYFGDWRRAAAVLFERHSLSGDTAPRREAGQGASFDVAHSLRARSNSAHRADHDNYVAASTGHTSHCLNAGGMGRIDYETETLVVGTLESGANRTGGTRPPGTTVDTADSLVVAFSCKDHGADAGEVSPTLRAMEFDGSHANGGGQVAVALAIRGRDGVPQIEMGDEVANAILTPNGGRGGIGVGAMMQGSAVRRLTPLECTRLQGFPDDYFDGVLYRGKPLADGPIYKMLGNSMAVPCMRWIGERIQMVDAL